MLQILRPVDWAWWSKILGTDCESVVALVTENAIEFATLQVHMHIGLYNGEHSCVSGIRYELQEQL